MHKMLFDNPVFHEGLNATVRLGTKWAERLQPGDFFEVEGVNGVARVKRVIVSPLLTVPGWVLKYEHDHACWDIEGLKQAMVRAYPTELSDLTDEELSAQLVTCVGFILYELYR